MRMKSIDRAMWKSLIVNLAINAVWQSLEWYQYGELQWYQWGDNAAGIIYIILIAWLFYKLESRGNNG